MKDPSTNISQVAESRFVDSLERGGYEVLERGYECQHGVADVVVMSEEGALCVFARILDGVEKEAEVERLKLVGACYMQDNGIEKTDLYILLVDYEKLDAGDPPSPFPPLSPELAEEVTEEVGTITLEDARAMYLRLEGGIAGMIEIESTAAGKQDAAYRLMTCMTLRSVVERFLQEAEDAFRQERDEEGK